MNALFSSSIRNNAAGRTNTCCQRSQLHRGAGIYFDTRQQQNKMKLSVALWLLISPLNFGNVVKCSSLLGLCSGGFLSMMPNCSTVMGTLLYAFSLQKCSSEWRQLEINWFRQIPLKVRPTSVVILIQIKPPPFLFERVNYTDSQGETPL